MRMEVKGGASTGYSYDCMNRITSATGVSFQWDDNGNLVGMDSDADTNPCMKASVSTQEK
jgi:hypothetical protein